MRHDVNRVTRCATTSIESLDAPRRQSSHSMRHDVNRVTRCATTSIESLDAPRRQSSHSMRHVSTSPKSNPRPSAANGLAIAALPGAAEGERAEGGGDSRMKGRDTVLAIAPC
eukprot:Selendium_serpulae@DN1085_c0_g1_i2.p2